MRYGIEKYDGDCRPNDQIGRRWILQAAVDESQRRSVNGGIDGRIAPARTEYTIQLYFRKIIHILRT